MLRRKPRPRPAPSGEQAAPVPVTRATVIDAEPHADGDAAERWLAALERDRDGLEDEVLRGLVTLNRALHAHAVAAHEAGVAQLARSAALAARVGYGTGDELADGRWTRAVEVPHRPERARRAEALRPAERLAAVLGGREEPDVCETMLLRARADLDAGREREAALQLRAGVEAMFAELGPDPGPDQSDDLATLGERRAEVERIAAGALAGAPSAGEAGELEATLLVAERILRRRRILGTG
jgi:hypothetical protein